MDILLSTTQELAAVGVLLKICSLEYGADVDSTPWEFFAPLYLAADAGRVKSVKTLLDRGANLNTRSIYPDDLEWTPLHTAADTETHVAVKLLLDRGPNIEATADKLYRSLYLAVSKDRHRTVELLLRRIMKRNTRM